MRLLTGGPDGVVHQLAFAPGGRELLSQHSGTSGVVVWDLAAGGCSTWDPAQSPTAFAVDHAGGRVAVGDRSGGCRLYSWPGRRAGASRRGLSRGRGDRVPAYLPEVERMAAGTAAEARDRWLAVVAGGVGVWNPSTGRADPLTPGGDWSAVCVRPDGATVAAADAVGPHVVEWALPLRNMTGRYPVRGPVLALEYTPDGSALAVGAGPADELRDPDGDLVWRTEVPGTVLISDFAFLPDGHLAVAAGTPAVLVLDPGTGAVARAYDFGHGKVFTVAVAPDGLTAAAGGSAGRVVVWDLDG